jgi:hypothetical protein
VRPNAELTGTARPGRLASPCRLNDQLGSSERKVRYLDFILKENLVVDRGANPV